MGEFQWRPHVDLQWDATNDTDSSFDVCVCVTDDEGKSLNVIPITDPGIRP